MIFIKVIDAVVALLKTEPGDDDDMKEVCENQIDEAQDDVKQRAQTMEPANMADNENKQQLRNCV